MCGQFDTDTEIASFSKEVEEVFQVREIINHPDYQPHKVKKERIKTLSIKIWNILLSISIYIQSADDVDNPNLAGGPVGGSDIAVYKVETSFKLGEVNSFPYALSREQIEAINSFTKLLDEDGVTNQIFNWIYDYNIPVSTTQEPPTVPPSPRPIHEDAINFYMQYFNLENRFKFGENWASTFYKRQYRRHIWPACFPLIDSEYPTRDPNKANGLTVGWEDVGPSFEQDERRNYLHENRVVYFEEVYSGKSRVRESFDGNAFTYE